MNRSSRYARSSRHLLPALALGVALSLAPAAQEPPPPAPGPAVAPAPEPEAAPEKSHSHEWKFSWEKWDGLHYKVLQTTGLATKVSSPRGKELFDFTKVGFTGKFGGKFAFDAAAFGNVHELEEVQSGTEVRRFRIYMTGDVVFLTPWSFRIELGKTGKDFTTEESWIQLRGFPKLGTLQIGYFTPTLSLENIMSARDLPFMELSAPVMALAPGPSVGAQLGRPAFGARMTWSLGLFSSPAASDTGDATKEAHRAMGRVTWLARDGDGTAGHALLHLGISGSQLYSGADTVRYRSRPESHLAPYMVYTDDIRADGSKTLGLEAAWVDGPLSIQGETLRTRVDSKSDGGLAFAGTYVSAGWFLTGENRTYSRPEGLFTRQQVFRSFSRKRGVWGALEVCGRYSVLDLDSGPVHGGRMRCLSAGLNWYLNPNAKVRLNLVNARSERLGVTSTLNAAEVRLEFDF